MDNFSSVGQVSPVVQVIYMYNSLALLQVPKARGKPLLQRESERDRERERERGGTVSSAPRARIH